MDSLADALTNGGHYEEAEKLERESLDVERRVFGAEDLRTLSSMSSLADTLRREGRFDEAERLQGNALDIERRILGPENPDVLYHLERKAIYLSLEGRFSNARKLFREAIETASKVNEPRELANAWYAFADGAAVTGNRREAFGYLEIAIDHRFAAFGWMESDPDLNSLHDDPRFEMLVAKARQNAVAETH